MTPMDEHQVPIKCKLHPTEFHPRCRDCIIEAVNEWNALHDDAKLALVSQTTNALLPLTERLCGDKGWWADAQQPYCQLPRDHDGMHRYKIPHSTYQWTHVQ